MKQPTALLLGALCCCWWLATLAAAAHLPQHDSHLSGRQLGSFVDPAVYAGLGNSTDPTVFQQWPGWQQWFRNARNLKGYNVTYTGQKAVSPMSSTILQTRMLTTPASATCAKLCAANPYCAAIEMFVERVPSSSNSANAAPAYQVACRLHNKALSSTDARYVGSTANGFYDTQAATTFFRRSDFRKRYPTGLGTSCKTAACASSLSCDAASLTCKLAAGSSCAGPSDNTKCSTGLCSSVSASIAVSCVNATATPLGTGRSCLQNADCASNNCTASAKRCAAAVITGGGSNASPSSTSSSSVSTSTSTSSSSSASSTPSGTLLADGELCVNATQCSSPYCANGACSATLLTNGAACSQASDCVASACDKSSGTGSCGLGTGQACTVDSECLVGRCDTTIPSPVCGVPIGSPCGQSENCSGNTCVNGYCVAPPRPNGWQCTVDSDCAYDNCDTTQSPPICGYAVGAHCKVATDCLDYQCDLSLAQAACGPGIGAKCSADTDCSTLTCASSACAAAASPSINSGLPCAHDGDCSARHCDTSLSTPLCGFAVQKTCADDTDCSSLTCVSSGASSQCAAASASPVANSLTCAHDGDCVSKTCDKTASACGLAITSPCTRDGDCSSLACSTSLVSPKCERLTTPVANGKPCTRPGDCSSSNCDNSLQAPLCGRSLDTQCAQDSDCSSLACSTSLASKKCELLTTPVTNGNPCTRPGGCSSGKCDNSLQVPLCGLSLQAQCAQDSDCSSQACATSLQSPVCEALAAPVANGESCGRDADCIHQVCSTITLKCIQTFRIRMTDASNPTSDLGYFGGLAPGKGTVSVVSDPSDAALYTADLPASATTAFPILAPAGSAYQFLGLVFGSNLFQGGDDAILASSGRTYVNVGYVSSVAAGTQSTSTSGSTLNDNGLGGTYESDVWYYDTFTSQLTNEWINPSGTNPPDCNPVMGVLSSDVTYIEGTCNPSGFYQDFIPANLHAEFL